MVATDRVRALFADARTLQADALEMLAQGRVRNAAEKAWGATKRATDALVLARRGEEPSTTNHTSRGIRALGQESPDLAALRDIFGRVARYLHSDCFYDGDCEPEEFTIELIHASGEYINAAECLANGHSP